MIPITAQEVTTVCILSVYFQLWWSIIVHYCPAGYHIIKLFRFLREVEIFFKPLLKGWNVVHTFIARFIHRSNLAM